METNSPRHCIHGVLWGCCVVCGLSINDVDRTEDCPNCAALSARVKELEVELSIEKRLHDRASTDHAEAVIKLAALEKGK